MRQHCLAASNSALLILGKSGHFLFTIVSSILCHIVTKVNRAGIDFYLMSWVREWDEVKHRHRHRLMSNAATSHANNEIAKPSKIESNRITPDKKCPALRKNSEAIRAGIAYQRMQPGMLLAGQTATKKTQRAKGRQSNENKQQPH
jgi:hypothetical protein